MDKELTFSFTGFTGLDVLRYLLPETWQAKHVARQLMLKVYKGIDLDKTPLFVRMPYNVYRVIDQKGNVEVPKEKPSRP